MESGLDTNSPVIDHSALEAIIEIFGVDDPGAILDLLDTFLTESAKQVADMHTSFAGGDWSKLHRMAHSLKSSSATFGANRLSHASAALELAAKGQCVDEPCPGLIEAVSREHQIACDILQAERVRLASA
jgi:HPt (histidine-containing phosphotransfer) domain-containing protein